MEKIISYSLFGEDMKYYVGAEKNIILNNKLLPDWKTVIYYHPEKIRVGYIDKLSNMGAQMIDVTEVRIGNKNSKEYPYFWRFLTFLQNNISLVRDLDSRVSEREVQYIEKWIKSEKDYFVIRDHPWHAPIPSGLFGIKGYKREFEKHFNEFVNKSDLRWGTDQEILYEYMNPISKDDIEYFGYDKPSTYIPRDNENFFIGMQCDENDNPTEPSGVQCLNYLKELKL